MADTRFDLAGLRAREARLRAWLATYPPLPVVEEFKGSAIFDGRALAAFDDVAALQEAAVTGRMMMADDAAEHLRIRRTDLDHLIRAGRLKPARWVEGEWKSEVPLYRAGDLDALATDASIDWAAVRATPAGHRSPLAKLPTKRSR